MAEGLIEGMLGGEEDRPEPDDVRAVAFAAAVAANLSNHNPDVAAKTATFLHEQTRLLKTQRKTAEAEYRYFEQEWAPRLLGLRLRAAFHLLAALVATVISVGALILIVDAVRSRSVVIDQFESPPALLPSGLNGTVVAQGLLDVLTRIQASTRSNAEHRAISDAWSNDIAIELPETGISIGQLQRMLKARFGHDQHVDGDLVQTNGGALTLTVRGNGILPHSFSDPGGDLDKLLIQAGEYVYGQSQPGLFVAYLTNSGKNEEAISFAKAAYGTAQLEERPYILNYWANAISNIGGPGTLHEALSLYREAVRLKPDYWTAYNNIMFALVSLGDEEGVVRVGLQMMKTAGGRPGRAPDDMYANYDSEVYDLSALRAGDLADMEAHGGIGTLGIANGPENLGVAQTDAALHDTQSASMQLKVTPVDVNSHPDVAAAATARAVLAEEMGDFKTAAEQWDVYAGVYSDPLIATLNPAAICSAAVPYEKTGQHAKADAALNRVGELNFVDCRRFRGDVLDLRGDWVGAQEWYAKAVELGPNLPAGYYSWGVALARHGNLPEAAAKLEQANRKGPHWADPLKSWGDVLAKQGKVREARAKYDEALKYAPNWKQLKEAREGLRN
jgi:tetratricopeptide (TPR) repeat protein